MPIPDLTAYNRKKAKGLAIISNTGDNKLFAITTQNFSSDDGTAADANVQGVYLKEINDAIAAKQVELDALKAFKADVVAAKVIVP